MQETTDREVDALQHQVAILEGALQVSQQDAELATARSKAQNRVLLRKVKASASAHVHVRVLLVFVPCCIAS